MVVHREIPMSEARRIQENNHSPKGIPIAGEAELKIAEEQNFFAIKCPF